MKILIHGIGNLLMGDGGVGVHAVRHLETRSDLPGVDLPDGGTGVFTCWITFSSISG